MKFSMTGQDKGDLLIQVTANRGDRLGRFDCTYIVGKYLIYFYSFQNRKEKRVSDSLFCLFLMLT
jgi:hypothetical protein